MLKMLVKSILPKIVIEKLIEVKNNYLDGYALKSYSQEGEDMILRRLFEKQKVGFYVDVGAHHPKRFSNTYFFYKKGWSGINIDAMPDSMKAFNKIRPRVILIEILGSSLQEIVNNKITEFLKKYNYFVYAKAVNTVIFISDEFYNER